MMAWTQRGASSFAGDIDFLILLILVIVGFWFVLAQFALFYFIIRFRQRDGVAAAHITGERRQEKRWINVPHMLIILCDVVILAFSFQVWSTIKQDLPPAEAHIRVIAHQWAWRFIHPGPDGQFGGADEVETVDELRLKVDTLYHFHLEAADVIHSLSIPAFRLKQDAVPGRVITGWFKPTKIGTFDIQCAEICGIGHGIMGARLIVESAEDHQSWLEQRMAQRTARR